MTGWSRKWRTRTIWISIFLPFPSSSAASENSGEVCVRGSSLYHFVKCVLWENGEEQIRGLVWYWFIVCAEARAVNGEKVTVEGAERTAHSSLFYVHLFTCGNPDSFLRIYWKWAISSGVGTKTRLFFTQLSWRSFLLIVVLWQCFDCLVFPFSCF